MKHHRSIGLIECGRLEESFIETAASLPETLQVRKAFVFHENAKTALCKRFPEVELTSDCNAIFQDESIGLVMISAPSNTHRTLIGAALRANKHVQIV